MKINIKLAVVAGAFAGLIGALAIFHIVFSGPRMKEQPNLRSLESAMQHPAAGSFPLDGEYPLPGKAQAKRMVNPHKNDAEAVSRGKVYYSYYCLPCHGEKGTGGPVGESYLPTPKDITDPDLGRYSDGELLLAMLKGNGHEPVLEYVVPYEHRWFLVSYLRSLSE